MTDLNQSFYESLSALSDDESSEIEVARVLRRLESSAGDGKEDTTMYNSDSEQACERQAIREKLAQYYAVKDELQGTALHSSASLTSFADSVMAGIDKKLYDEHDDMVEAVLTEAAVSDSVAVDSNRFSPQASANPISVDSSNAAVTASNTRAANDSWYKKLVGQSAIAASVALVAVFGFQQFNSGSATVNTDAAGQFAGIERAPSESASQQPQNRAVVPDGYSAPNLVANTVAGGSSSAVNIDELVYNLQRLQQQNRELTIRLQALTVENQKLRAESLR